MIIFYSQSNYRAGILLIMKVVNSVIKEGEVEVNRTAPGAGWLCGCLVSLTGRGAEGKCLALVCTAAGANKQVNCRQILCWPVSGELPPAGRTLVV